MNEIKLGIAPINWSNDDLPELGKDISLETCLIEIREAGYQGTEIGHKFPTDPLELKTLLDHFDLELASCWHSTFFSVKEESNKQFETLKKRLEFLNILGAKQINLAECNRTIHNKTDVPLANKPVLDKKEWDLFTSNLNKAGKICREHNIYLAYHHHMGTVVQNLNEIEQLLKDTSPDDISLCFDSGHLLFAGIDPIWFLTKHMNRISHVHLKDIRSHVLKKNGHRISFLDAVLKGIFTVPGDGMIPFATIFQELKQKHYKGWLIVEAEQDPDIAPPFTYAKKAYSFIKPQIKS